MDDWTLDRKEIGRRLVKLRGARTQDEVAQALGISKSALSMYENGERIPRDPLKVRMAKYYGRSVPFIFFVVSDHDT